MINYDLYNIICNDNNKRSQTFQTSWAKGRLWLVFDEDLNMFCSTCWKKNNSDSKLFEFLICSHLNVLRHLQWLCTKIQCQFIWSMVTKKSNIAMQSNNHTSSINTIRYPNYMYWCTGMHAKCTTFFWGWSERSWQEQGVVSILFGKIHCKYCLKNYPCRSLYLTFYTFNIPSKHGPLKVYGNLWYSSSEKL